MIFGLMDYLAIKLANKIAEIFNLTPKNRKKRKKEKKTTVGVSFFCRI